MSRILFLLFFISSTALGQLPNVFAQHEGHEIQPQAKQKDVYYCPMHPGFTSDKPGDCAICGMKLVKKDESPAPASSGQGFYVSQEKQQLIGVKIGKAGFKPIVKMIRTVGRVVFDPELYKAQTEYIEALNAMGKLKDSQDARIIGRAQGLVDAAYLKLTLNGLSQEQIEELAEKKEGDRSLLISSSDSPETWVYATIYENELEWVKIGQEAGITAAAYPSREFSGKIIAIDPVFEAMSRSVRARIKADNKDGLLKPNMYVDVEIRSDLGPLLVVPKEAVMDSGLRKIVFISLPDGYIQSREVKTGVSSDEYVQIIEGINAGEDVIVSGNFLIDSESRLKSALEGTGHQH